MSLGWTLNLFLLDECTRHDSSCVIECIARTLEDVKRIAETTGRSMPSTVFVCSDNTPREAKNQYMLSYLVALTSKNLCRCTCLLNLRKSHSHDQVDQLWGILARRISSCDSLKSPQSVISTLESELARPGLKSWIVLQTATSVCKIDSVRNWKSHFAPQQVSISGGLKEDTTANHCFLMMQRRGSLAKKHDVYKVCFYDNVENLKENR